MTRVKLLSWNVNGIRAAMNKGFADFLAAEKPDVIGLQEIKVTDAAREAAALDFPGYEELWYPAERPGYSGTAILSKTAPLSYQAGMDAPDFDIEGRTLTAEFDHFYFVTCYFPNSKDDLSRIPYKVRFNETILKYVKKLEKKKPVVLVGDFNVAHEPIDLARPKDNEGKKGFTKEERSGMTKFLKSGLIDSFRMLHPDQTQYSWWSYYSFARDRNIGWRIDYVLISETLKPKLTEAFILDQVLGSDHAPVGITLTI